MSTIKFSANKQNIQQNNTQRNIPHPSIQSQAKPFKPSIKVGYEIETSREQVMRRYKKPVIVLKHQQKQNLGVKKVQNGSQQIKSGVFLNSQYIPNHSNKEKSQFHRKGVVEVQQKIHGSRQFSENLKKQFVKRCRSTVSITENNSMTERSKLSGYRNQGIKDIIQYKHAGDYRESKIATKCTNENANNRCLSYRQLHEFDFRKMRQYIK